MRMRLDTAVKELNSQLEEFRQEAARASKAPIIVVINAKNGHQPSSDEIREEMLRLVEERRK